MTEYLLTYAGFSKTPGICHVIAADESTDVLVGNLDDNPGTSVINATEEIGWALSRLLFDDADPTAFRMFEYDPRGVPSLEPTTSRVQWNGEPGTFAMPTWVSVESEMLAEIADLLRKVRVQGYTFDALSSERDLIHIESPELARRQSEHRSPQTVTPAAFREHFKPIATAIRDFAESVAGLCERDRLPSATSAAVQELAAERELKPDDSWAHPLTDAHALGAISLRAGADHVRSFADLLVADTAPLYGHLVLAKAAFEASVVADWLQEPGIPYRDRIQRALYEQVLSATEQVELGIDPAAAGRFAELSKSAELLGWSVEWQQPGRPTVSGLQRPSIAQGITKLLGRPPDGTIGPILWQRLTAVSEASLWGLLWAVQDQSEPDPAGLVRAEFGTWSPQVATQAYCIVETLRVAADHRAQLMGWENDDDWLKATLEIRQIQLTLLAMVDHARNGPAAQR
jgi:hypothetical protein